MEAVGSCQYCVLRVNHSEEKGTNVGNVDLPASAAAAAGCSSGRSTEAAGSLETTATGGAAFEASARCGRVAETRLGLSVFANVYESAHEVLVAERRNGILRLLPSGVLHDTTALHPSKSRQPPIFFTIKTSHQ
jgi:hypothetical protein